ncbi:hypothetical protein RRG08_047737 [Elysia crispata]|uniref:Uncharacterized protein n=1 Tax=Elysia crispata TaxID=231223 RepID=A0AAE1AAT6_9GAST|nr:hypothetical protein RRG08_047737 [Elysia crispata]
MSSSKEGYYNTSFNLLCGPCSTWVYTGFPQHNDSAMSCLTSVKLQGKGPNSVKLYPLYFAPLSLFFIMVSCPQIGESDNLKRVDNPVVVIRNKKPRLPMTCVANPCLLRQRSQKPVKSSLSLSVHRRNPPKKTEAGSNELIVRPGVTVPGTDAGSILFQGWSNRSAQILSSMSRF